MQTGALADRLRLLLRDRVQAEEARALHVHRSTLNGWLSGRAEPNSDMLRRICQRHSVSADWLLGLEQPGEIAEPPAPAMSPPDPMASVERIGRVLASQVEDLSSRVHQLERENSTLRAEVKANVDLEQTYVTEAGRIWEEVLGDLPKPWQLRILRRLGVMGAGGATVEDQQEDTPGAAAR